MDGRSEQAFYVVYGLLEVFRGFFQSGLNTLDFKVDFADSRAEGVIVAGLTLTTPVVPEASNLAVGGLSGALVLGSLLRRRRRAAA